MNGFLIINKETGITSFDVIRQLRKKLGQLKMGHLGTLDPLATGVLVVAINKATKLVEYLMGEDKEYEVEAVFGASSDTYDRDGEITPGEMSGVVLHPATIKETMKSFVGEIDQIPPKFSALKVRGMRACDRVRRGEDVQLASRKIKIHEFELLELKQKIGTFRVRCSSGTYIRSLINDLGQKLGVGAYVEKLNRTKVGDFSIEDAVRVDDVNIDNIGENLISLRDAMKVYEHIELTEDEYNDVKDGKQIGVGLHQIKSQNDSEVVIGLYKDELKTIFRLCEGKLKIQKNL